MDFYQNEEIVKKQRALVSQNIQPGQKISRNIYMQFVVEDQ